MAISGLLIVCSILKILDKIPKNLKLLASLNYPLTPGHPMRMKAKRQLRLWEVLPKGAKIRKTINCGSCAHDGMGWKSMEGGVARSKKIAMEIV